MYNFALSICVHGGAVIVLLTLSPLLAAPATAKNWLFEDKMSEYAKDASGWKAA